MQHAIEDKDVSKMARDEAKPRHQNMQLYRSVQAIGLGIIHGSTTTKAVQSKDDTAASSLPVLPVLLRRYSVLLSVLIR
jgi:hypothetical protein